MSDKNVLFHDAFLIYVFSTFVFETSCLKPIPAFQVYLLLRASSHYRHQNPEQIVNPNLLTNAYFLRVWANINEIYVYVHICK